MFNGMSLLDRSEESWRKQTQNTIIGKVDIAKRQRKIADSRERSGREKSNKHRAPTAKKTDRKAEQGESHRIHTAFSSSLPPSLSPERRSQIKYTPPSQPMAPHLSRPLLADTVTKFHAVSTPVSCSGTPQRYAITGLAGSRRRDRDWRRRTRGRTNLKVKAVAAESRSSEGGIAEDYYAVLGVVGASS